jgi:hypothetical protein
MVIPLTISIRLAEYHLNGLGSGVTSVPSTINTGSHPSLVFPGTPSNLGLGSVFAGQNFRNPAKYPQGVLINERDYLYISNNGEWITSPDMYGIVYIWMFFIEGEMGTFTDYRLTVKFHYSSNRRAVAHLRIYTEVQLLIYF